MRSGRDGCRDAALALSQHGRPPRTARGELDRVEEIGIPAGAGLTLPARLYAPTRTVEPGPVTLFYHGGGWTLGDLDTYDSLCAEIARGLGMTIVSVAYRLARENPFPAAADDAVAAAR